MTDLVFSILLILQLAPTDFKSGSIFSSEFPQRCPSFSMIYVHCDLIMLAKTFLATLQLFVITFQEVTICLAAYLLAPHQNFNLSLACQGEIS